MLVGLGSNLQFHRVSAAVLSARDRLGAVILIMGGLHMTAAPGTMALNGLAIFLQLFVVVGDDFVRCVVGEELRGHHFQRKSRHRKIYIGALLVVAVVFRSGLGAGIKRQAGIPNIGFFGDAPISHGRICVVS